MPRSKGVVRFGLAVLFFLIAGVALGAGTFTDDDGNTHEANIEALAAEGITRGCNPPANDRYCPSDSVTRGQMAAFLRRAFGLPASDQDHFTDDDGTTFEADINAIAEAGITKGCNPPSNTRYCPSDPVTRGQMAALIRRTFDYPTAAADFFTDDDSSIFEADINAIAAQGVTKGCNPPENTFYCPDDLVRRDQMASFLARALELAPIPPKPPGGDGGGVGCDFVVSVSTSDIDGAGNYAGVGPGDVVCLEAGTRDTIDVRNLHGTSSDPITIINSGGAVLIDASGSYAGIEVENSSGLRITGSGSVSKCGAAFPTGSQQCGIVIEGSEDGVVGKVRTEGIQIDHVEIRDLSDTGISIKDDELGRGEWVLRGVRINDSYFHDIYDEGIYVGSSDYATGEYHVLADVHVSDSLFIDTGRDGIQVGSTTSNCTISRNVVIRPGQNDESSHRAGIMNNKGSVCDIVGNLIVDSAGWGIYVQGNGGNEIYNNVVIRSGRFVSNGDGDGDGISIHDGSNVDRSIYVWNNTVISSRGDGIGFGNDVGTDNQIINNLVADAGGDLISGSDAQQVSHNLASQNLNDFDFVDPAADNYRLRATSPAVDAGLDLSSKGVTVDHDGKRRPAGSATDIGAYESH